MRFLHLNQVINGGKKKTNILNIIFYDGTERNIHSANWNEEENPNPWEGFCNWFFNTEDEYYLLKLSKFYEKSIISMDMMFRRSDIKRFEITVAWESVLEKEDRCTDSLGEVQKRPNAPPPCPGQKRPNVPVPPHPAGGGGIMSS
jgi:hypothetical protein